MSMAAASPRHTASPPSPPPGVVDPNATPAALAKLLADQLHECEALRGALSAERARADAAERQLAALQGPPATAIAEYEERLRQADQAPVAADRMRESKLLTFACMCSSRCTNRLAMSNRTSPKASLTEMLSQDCQEGMRED